MRAVLPSMFSSLCGPQERPQARPCGPSSFSGPSQLQSLALPPVTSGGWDPRLLCCPGPSSTPCGRGTMSLPILSQLPPLRPAWSPGPQQRPRPHLDPARPCPLPGFQVWPLRAQDVWTGWGKDTATGHQWCLVVHARPLQAFCVKPGKKKKIVPVSKRLRWPEMLVSCFPGDRLRGHMVVQWGKAAEAPAHTQLLFCLATASPAQAVLRLGQRALFYLRRWVLFYLWVLNEETGEQRIEVTCSRSHS